MSKTDSMNKMVPAWIIYLVFGLAAALIALSTYRVTDFEKSATTPAMTETLALASHLAHDRRTGEPEAHDRIAPAGGIGYAMILSAFAAVDANVQSGLSCHADKNRCARSQFRIVIIAQYLLAVAALGLMFWIAATLSRSWLVAITTVVLAFLAGTYGSQAGILSPLPWTKFLALCALGALAAGIHQDQPFFTGLAGVALGTATLFMPDLILVGVLTAALLLVVGFRVRGVMRAPASHALVFLVGALIIPTFTLVLHAQADVFFDVVSDELHENWIARLKWSALSASDQRALLLAPVPIVGAAVQAIFGIPSVEHLERIAASAEPAADAVAYLTATPGLFFRGLWAGTPIVTLLGVLHLWPLLSFSNADGRFGPIAVVAGMVFLIVFVHALIRPNAPEHNVGLIFLLGFASAYVFGRSEVRRNDWPTFVTRGQAA